MTLTETPAGTAAGWAPPEGPPQSRVVTTGRTRRWVVAALVAAGALATAVALVGAGGETALDPRLLVIDDEGTVSLVDPQAERAAFDIAGAIPSGDRSLLFTVDVDGDATRVDTLDASTGAPVGSLDLPGALSIRAVAPRGGTVALMPEDGSPDSAYAPSPRATTEITVVDAASDLRVTHRLDGNLEPEIFSTDADTLFLLEYWPPLEPDRYFVRQLDVETGEIADVYSPEVDLEPEMRGTARAQAMDPGGAFLYTLYTLPSGAGVHDPAADAGESERWGFIHALNLDEEWSFCIFLPVPFGAAGEGGIDLAISPDGDTLVVADAATSTMAFVDTDELAVTDVGSVDQLRPGGIDGGPRPLLALTDDRTVFMSLGWSIVAIDGERFEPDGAWVYDLSASGPARPVSDLDLAPDGSELRVAVDGEIVMLDPATGRATAAVSVEGGGVTFLGPPDGTILDIPIECAC